MTIVNMVGGGGTPEGDTYTLNVLVSTSITSNSHTSGTDSYSRDKTLTYGVGTVTLYPEIGCYKITPPDITTTFGGSSSNGVNRSLNMTVPLSSADKEVYNKIYDVMGGEFYIEFLPYYKADSYYFKGDIVRSRYSKSTNSVYCYRGFVITTSTRPTSVYLIPIGIHPVE